MATSEIRSSWRQTQRMFSDLVSCCRELSNSMSPFAFFPGYSQHDAENPAAVRENYPEQIGKVCSAASNDSVTFQIQLEREAAKTAAPCWWGKSFPGWRIKQYFQSLLMQEILQNLTTTNSSTTSSPNTLCFCLPQISPETLIMGVDLQLQTNEWSDLRDFLLISQPAFMVFQDNAFQSVCAID